MEKLRGYLFSLISLVLLFPISFGQLTQTQTQTETTTLFQVQKILEYPQVLQGWTNWTNFCYLPPSPSLKIICINNTITELTVVGNKTSHTQNQRKSIPQQTLSKKFSIDSLITVLTKLTNLKSLSLVSLGLWGPLPGKINRLSSLEVLNISSNFINGRIPPEILSLKNLKNLVLSDNLFNGSTPDLTRLSALQELNLNGNHLGPKFPSLSNSLVKVLLRNNGFRSGIPSNLKKLNQLQILDISSNKFIGPIPFFIFSLNSIQTLNLNQNQLSGGIPVNASCSSTLKFVDVSRNLLTGKLPTCVSSNRSVVSSWNCLSGGKYQHPYSFCHKEALAVKPPAETKEGESGINIGLVLAGIGSVVGAAGVIGLLAFFVVKRLKKMKGEEDEDRVSRTIDSKMTARTTLKPKPQTRRVPQTMRSAAIGLQPYRVFTLEEIEDATNNFDPANLIGEESERQLYRGWIRDGTDVIVKCFKLKQRSLPQSLMQQMEVLSKLRHRHLVSVLGHCVVTYQDQPHTESCTIFVVLEQIGNGSLHDSLTDGRKREMLKWPQRMAITIGIARGLQFLHTGVAPGIFGNNLKIKNILLDESLTPKITAYNIPLPSKIESESPLHGQDVSNLNSNENAEKEDVYQFGVILLEIITGRLVTSTSELNNLKLQLESSLAEGVSELRSLIDPSVKGTYAYESMRTAVEFTVNCLCKDPKKRPSIEDVIWNLQYTIQVQEGWASSGNLSTQM